MASFRKVVMPTRGIGFNHLKICEEQNTFEAGPRSFVNRRDATNRLASGLRLGLLGLDLSGWVANKNVRNFSAAARDRWLA